uniref:Gibberellin 2-beta-dioxygenase n=1 Tax=Citrullus lanatus TaxID=3654 RepID=A0A9E9AUP8_CITLA|nr:gibberellin 2-beta-dioxygenase [Citrullus lanatus]WAH72556.1 gibberellin 2-beta-dioxygenase [Citrullus lanatus]WAH72557.1 gibberellin 2-beta-dioxygenase [Citrullus lanatus]WAH72558.1 gibberellin 2-beta-dioxygenase [Citrullus lanatus]WAH72559.1 gibberellin 2-beta-dioxygenase [Citrullus lanatus]
MSSKEWIDEIPVMDIDAHSFSESAICSLRRACKEWGFFFIRNHGVPKEFFRKLISDADRRLFTFPDETKRKLKVGASSYTPRFVVSPSLESFKVLGPNFSASAIAHGFTDSLFGHQATQFRNLLDEYGSKMIEISKRVVQLLLKTLGDDIETKFYDSEFSNCYGYIRINRYSPQDLNDEEEMDAFKQHTDISYVTILFQDDVGGLQMRSKGGEWFDVKPSEDGDLLVNIGDFMEGWSNGRVKSAEHRVVLRKNNVKTRFSVAFFLTNEDDDNKEIYAPSEVVGEGKSRLYLPFSTKEYRLFREKNYGRIGATLKDFTGI